MRKKNKNLTLNDFKKSEVKNLNSLIGGNAPAGGVLTKKPKIVKEED